MDAGKKSKFPATTLQTPPLEAPSQWAQHVGRPGRLINQTALTAILETKAKMSKEMQARNDTCIFLMTSPGSGSSTMVSLINKAAPECEISGENHGAIADLANFAYKLEETELQMRRTRGHSAAAWHKVFDYPAALRDQHRLATTILNPNHRRCWGYKEIRHGTGLHENFFDKDIRFLQTLCARPRFVIHTRSLKAELHSSIVANNGHADKTRRQHACFGAYLDSVLMYRAGRNPRPSNTRVPKGCYYSPELGREKPMVFNHTLEDYTEHTVRHEQLWDFLGFLPPPKDTPTIWQRHKHKMPN